MTEQNRDATDDETARVRAEEQRYHELRGKWEAGTLTPDEDAEFTALLQAWDERQGELDRANDVYGCSVPAAMAHRGDCYAELEKREGELIFAYNNLQTGQCAEDVLKAIAETQVEMMRLSDARIASANARVDAVAELGEPGRDYPLYLHIDKNVYLVECVPGYPVNGVSKCYRLHKCDSDKVYDCVQFDGGKMECDCENFTYVQSKLDPPGLCKHLTALSDPKNGIFTKEKP